MREYRSNFADLKQPERWQEFTFYIRNRWRTYEERCSEMNRANRSAKTICQPVKSNLLSTSHSLAGQLMRSSSSPSPPLLKSRKPPGQMALMPSYSLHSPLSQSITYVGVIACNHGTSSFRSIISRNITTGA